MTRQYRTVGVFNGTHHQGSIRTSRRDADRDAEQFLAAGAEVVIITDFDSGFWMLRAASDIIVRDGATP